MGRQGDLVRRVQSPAGGGLGVEAALAEGPGFWKLYLNSAVLFQSPARLSTSLVLAMAKRVSSPRFVGRNPKKQTPWSLGGDGTFPCRRGCGQQARGGDRRCLWHDQPRPRCGRRFLGKSCSFGCTSAGDGMRSFERLKEALPDLWKPLLALTQAPTAFPC